MQKKSGLSTGLMLGIGIFILLFGFVLGDRWPQAKDRLFNRSDNVNAGLPEDLDYSEVEDVYDTLRKNYDGQLNVEDLLDGLKSGLAKATDDTYTVYLNEEESNSFLSDLNGKFTGIGAELGLENDRLIIVAPLDGFPADKAGLRSKDVIVKINGEDAFGIKVEEAVSKIRGPEGTDVTLTIEREGKQFDITLTREEIVVPSVISEIKNDVGILKISRFAEDTVKLANQAAQDFRDQGVKGVILDLRNNGGGYLNGAVSIADLWIDGDIVVQERRGDSIIDTQKASKGALLGGIKTIVLINQGSASASEIVAGALKDYNLATLVGETSFGKGSVQDLQKLGSGGTLKVTVARWYTPKGNNIDKEGVKPDIEIKLSEEDIKNARDTQLIEAEKLLN